MTDDLQIVAGVVVGTILSWISYLLSKDETLQHVSLILTGMSVYLVANALYEWKHPKDD